MIRKINVICLAFLLTIIGAFDAYASDNYGRHSCSANDMYRAIVAHSACFLWGN